MIHVVRQKEPNFPPDPGHTRTTIGQWVVDWSATEPTSLEVAEFIAPSAETIAANERTEVKRELLGNKSLARAVRAILKITKPAGVTAAQWRAEFLAAIDSDTTTTALRNQATDITAVSAGGELTVTALTTAPASGDTFGIY